MQIQPVHKTAIYQDIVKQIKTMLDDGDFTPGDRLPSERKLAELFAVSRTTVREAIRALADQGLLESRQGAGTFVAAHDRDRFADVFAGVILRGQRGLRDIFGVRWLLEPDIAALAARHATKSDIRRMEDLVEAQSAALTDDESGADIDLKLHSLFAEASGNKVLHALVGCLHEEFSESRARGLQSKERQKASLAAHRAIVDAIRDGNPEQARQAMCDHLDEIERIVFANNTPLHSSKEES